MSRTVTTALASAAAGAALVLAFVVGTHNAVPAPDVVIPASSPAEVAPAVVVGDDPTPEPTVEPKTEKPAPVEVKPTAPRVVHEPAPVVSDDAAAQEAADRAEAAAKRAEKAADKAETETKPASPGPDPKPGSAGTTGVDPAGTSGTGNVTKTCVAPGVCSG